MPTTKQASARYVGHIMTAHQVISLATKFCDWRMYPDENGNPDFNYSVNRALEYYQEVDQKITHYAKSLK